MNTWFGALLVGALWLSVPGCGDDAEPPADAAMDSGIADASTTVDAGDDALPAFRSGTRLRARTLSDQPDGFRDTELDIVCRFEAMDDGVLRCLPEEPEATIAYLDDACTMPVIIVDDCTPGVAGAYRKRRAALLACGTIGYTAVRLGAPGNAATYYFQNDGGPCEGFAAEPGTTHHAFEDVPGDTFVGATRTVTDIDDSVAVQHLVAEDGAVLAETLIDREFGVPCTPDVVEPARCVPMAIGRWTIRGDGPSGYRTADCSEQLAYETSCRDPGLPDIAVSLTGGSVCGGVARSIVRTGEEVPVDQVVRGGTDMCPAGDPPPTQRYYRVVEEIAREDLVPVQRITVGDGVVQAYWWSLDGITPRVPAGGWYDTATDVDCRRLEIGDSTRCLPSTALTLPSEPNSFSDAACTAQLVSGGNIMCAAPAPTVLVDYAGGFCAPSSIRLLEPVAVTPTIQYSADGMGGCTEIPARTDVSLFELGAERPADSLPLMELVEHP